MSNTKYIEDAMRSFGLRPGKYAYRKYGDGHINDTYLCESTEGRVALQRINSNVFKNPHLVMENAFKVTRHIADYIQKSGGDPKCGTLMFLATTDNKPYFTDGNGEVWRATYFLEGTTTYSRAEDEAMLESAAGAFGRFMMMLADYPADTLHETIPDFHNTPKRFEQFVSVLEKDEYNRAAQAREAVNFVLEREDKAGFLVNMLNRGELPLRVTHNDTKLNNVLFRQDTGKAICAIDLDTVMPGLSAYDFGDAIRSGANMVDEDKAKRGDFSFNFFKAYAKGYIDNCGCALTQNECDVLAPSAILLSFECGMRFLTDYLDGDKYFKTEHQTHNLQRAISQFNLVSDMEQQRSSMEKLIKELVINAR
ncbi:MAG: aminoglycoside phosphotransferase family protein [Clostridia bacterium]|nr:aminoglycoside phosphotransferase family protein [Clostridia bacterium]